MRKPDLFNKMAEICEIFHDFQERIAEILLVQEIYWLGTNWLAKPSEVLFPPPPLQFLQMVNTHFNALTSFYMPHFIFLRPIKRCLIDCMFE